MKSDDKAMIFICAVMLTFALGVMILETYSENKRFEVCLSANGKYIDKECIK